MVAADPAAIASMIHLNADGTETVDLWSQTQGHMPGNDTTSFKAAPQTVSNSFAANAANNGAGQDVVGTQKEIWVQVLEKAYAQANGGYARIQNGGGPGRALEQLTGQAAAWAQPANLTASVLLKDIAAKDLIVLDTSHATA